MAKFEDISFLRYACFTGDELDEEEKEEENVHANSESPSSSSSSFPSLLFLPPPLARLYQSTCCPPLGRSVAVGPPPRPPSRLPHTSRVDDSSPKSKHFGVGHAKNGGGRDGSRLEVANLRETIT